MFSSYLLPPFNNEPMYRSAINNESQKIHIVLLYIYQHISIWLLAMLSAIFFLNIYLTRGPLRIMTVTDAFPVHVCVYPMRRYFSLILK